VPSFLRAHTLITRLYDTPLLYYVQRSLRGRLTLSALSLSLSLSLSPYSVGIYIMCTDRHACTGRYDGRRLICRETPERPTETADSPVRASHRNSRERGSRASIVIRIPREWVHVECFPFVAPSSITACTAFFFFLAPSELRALCSRGDFPRRRTRDARWRIVPFSRERKKAWKIKNKKIWELSSPLRDARARERRVFSFFLPVSPSRPSYRVPMDAVDQTPPRGDAERHNK